MLLYPIVIAVVFALSGVKGQVPGNHYQNCAPPGTVQSGPGVTDPIPSLPTLPHTFQVRVEANMLDKNKTVEATEYVDRPNNRAAIHMIQNNKLFRIIFDYQDNQIIYVSSRHRLPPPYPRTWPHVWRTVTRPSNSSSTTTSRRLSPVWNHNDVCFTSTLSTDVSRLLFGSRTSSNSAIPHIPSTTAVLQFAKSNGLTYMGKTSVRGIHVDHWVSCMYWPEMLANFTIDFYWSSPAWTDSVLYPQVPVRAEVTGQVYSPGGPIPLHDFHHIYDYYDFRDRIWDNDSVFQTPEGTVCTNRKQTRPVPTLPDQFFLRAEIIDVQSHTTKFSDVWYDYTHKLMRIDFRLSGNVFPYYTANPVTEIHDYNTGIAYIQTQDGGNCSTIPIPNSTIGTMFSAINVSTNGAGRPQFFYQMTQSLYLDNTFTYEGKRTVRGLLCDVFISKRVAIQIDAYNTANSTCEYYFLDKSWSSVSNMGGNMSQVGDIPIGLDLTYPWGSKLRYNFYDFAEAEPPVNTFNIKNCFDDYSQMPLIITFPGRFDASLNAYKANFLYSTLDTLQKVAHVSQIRIQNPEFHINANRTYFVGTLLDLPPSIAFFRKLPGMYHQFSNDASITTLSAHDCAQQCNGGYRYRLPECNSFDYCPTSMLCSLSKTHTEDGSLVDSRALCDHYSRTSQKLVPELTLSESWRSVRNTVFSGAFQIVVDVGNGVNKTYTATSTQQIEDHPTPQTVLSNFNVYVNKVMPHRDELIFTGLAVDDCAKECQMRQEWVCNSFWMNFQSGYCSISKAHPEEYPGGVVDQLFTNLYSRKYTAQYERLPGKTVPPTQIQYGNTNTADMCAKLCSNNNGFNCLSFDYCDDTHACYLGQTRHYGTPDADTPSVTPSCVHYTRNHLHDFSKVTRKSVATVGATLVTGVDVSECAHLCVRQEQTNCASFGYCGNVTTCLLTSPSMATTSQTTRQNALWCDVYRRQTFADGTPYVNNLQNPGSQLVG